MKDTKDLHYIHRPVRTWTPKQLKTEHRSLWEAVNIIGCCGTRDMTLLDNIEAELDRRGYEIIESQKVEYQRKED